MLKEYSICNIIGLPLQYIPCFAGSFEGTEDADLEWPHRHTFYSIVWFTKGSGTYVIDFEEYEIHPDRIFFVTPKQIHNWDYSDDSEGYVLIIDQILGKELIIDNHYTYIDLEKSDGRFLKSVIENLLSAYNKGYDIKTDIQYIYNLLYRFAKPENAALINNNRVFEQLRQYIFSNLSQDTTIETCSAKLNKSPEELLQVCKTITGKTFKQYILDIKITEAKRLLLFSGKNINEISLSLGFEDSSYFTRIFKKKTLYSPSDFRKKYRKQK